MTKDRGSVLILVLLFIFLVLILFLLLFFYKPSRPQQSPGLTKTNQSPGYKWEKAEKLIKNGSLPKPQKILQITLDYKKESTPSVKLRTVKLMNGYEPTFFPSEKNNYKIQAVDKNGGVIKELRVVLPSFSYMESLQGNSGPEGTALIENPSYIYTLNYLNSMEEIKILDNSDNLIESRKLTDLKYEENSPDYSVLTKKKLTDRSFFNDTFLHPAFASAIDRKLHFTFVNQGFSDEGDFNSKVSEYTNYLLSLEPFKSRQSQLSFESVFNIGALDCELKTPAASIDYLIPYCNQESVIRAVQLKVANSEMIYVLVKTDNTKALYGGTGSFTGNVRVGAGLVMDPDVGKKSFAHEMGHMVGNLIDEYNALLDYDRVTGNATFFNCYVGEIPSGFSDPKWQGVSPGDLVKGCNNPDWYRSSYSSVMGTSDIYSDSYNTVSQRLISARLDWLVGTSNTPQPGAVTGTTSTVDAPPICKKNCIYSDRGSCFKGYCLDPNLDCSDNINCGYVAGCDGVGQGLACPAGNSGSSTEGGSAGSTSGGSAGTTSGGPTSGSSGTNANSDCGYTTNSEGLEIPIPCYKIGVFDEQQLALTRNDARLAQERFAAYEQVLRDIGGYIREIRTSVDAKNAAAQKAALECLGP